MHCTTEQQQQVQIYIAYYNNCINAITCMIMALLEYIQNRLYSYTERIKQQEVQLKCKSVYHVINKTN